MLNLRPMLIFIATLKPSWPDPEITGKLTFILTLFCGAAKSFMKALKAFTKPFEAPQRPSQNL